MKKFAVGLIVVALLFALVPAVFADDQTPEGEVTVQGGTLNNTPQDFDFTVQLNGSDQSDTYTDFPTDWQVIDARGNGAGWHMDISASEFVCDSVTTPTCDGHNIPLVLTDKHNGLGLFRFQLVDADIYWVDGSYGSCTAGDPADCDDALDMDVDLDVTEDVYYGDLMPTATGFTSITALTDTPTKFMTTEVGEGMGTYRFDPDFDIFIPAETYAGIYTSTLTVSAITAT